MTLDEMMGVNGHVNRLTAKIYLRNSGQKMAVHGAKIQGAATGLALTKEDLPDFSYVVLRDGVKIFPRSIMTTTESGLGLISVMEKDRVEESVDATKDVTTGIRQA
jgi:hypothetical protein